MNSEQPFPFNELFPIEGPGTPVQFSQRQADAIVQGALDAWQVEQPKVIHGRWKRALLLAAATFAVASAAAGLIYVGYTDRPSLPIGPATSSQGATTPPSLQQPLPSQTHTATPSPTEPASVARPESGPQTSRLRLRPRYQPAEDLLLTANQLRAQGRWSAAEQTYNRVCTIYPDAPSAYVASIAAASIRLEHLGDPTGALKAYQRAINLNPQGALDIEARLGIARSWQQLEKRDLEIAALQALLNKHSSGPMVQRAKRRLEAIAGGR